MAVNDNPSRKQYTQGPGGATTDWPVDFKFSADEDLVVITTDPTGVDTTLTLDSEYSVTGAGSNDGGTVTIDPPVTAGHRVTIYREIDLDQPTVLPSSGGWFPKVHEAVFDRIVMQIQQLYDAVERSVKLSPTSTDSAADLSVLLESIDENAAAAETAKNAAQAAQAATEETRDTIISDAEAAAAAVASPYADAAQAAQALAEDAQDAAETARDEAVAAAQNLSSQKYEATATAGQTVITPGFTWDDGAGNIVLYIDGVFQSPSTYTLTSPTITLSEALAGVESIFVESINFAAAPSAPLYVNNNLSDLADVGEARDNLNLGTAALLDVGTAALNAVQLDADGKLPAVSGELLTGITAAQISGLSSGMPTGAVVAVASSSVPSGFLECNGAAVSRTSYASLYAAIGVVHGYGDNSTTFNLPDYRGRFLRGWDHAIARDPDRASRTAMATGGATGDTVGSVQTDAFKSHTHTIAASAPTTAAGSTSSLGSPNNASQTSNSTGGNETRPINANVMYCIKY